MSYTKAIVKTCMRNYDDSHSYNHIRRVRKTALSIYKKHRHEDDIQKIREMKFDPKLIIKIASLIHDAYDHKYVDQKKGEQIKNILRNAMELDGLDVSDISLVFDIVENISFSREKSGLKDDLEVFEVLRNIVSDADKIDAINVERCREFAIQKMISNKEEFNDKIINEKVYKHILEKLILLKDEYIYTDYGKKLAEKPHKKLLEWIDENIHNK